VPENRAILLALAKPGNGRAEGGSLAGVVESHETYVGSKAKNMHKSRRQERIKGTGGLSKAVVRGLLERPGKKGESKVKASVPEALADQ
jgi:hypothetical protein